MSLKEIIKRNSYCYALCKTIYCFKQLRFRKYVMEYKCIPVSESANVAIKHQDLIVNEYGDLNNGKVILYLENYGGHAGFGALWIYFLNRLSFSDRMGFQHVINCVQSDFYKEDHPINGSDNIFEYYFLQPSGISIKEVFQSKNVIIDCNSDSLGFNDYFHAGGKRDYQFDEKDIEGFSEIQKKYLRLQPYVEDQINKDFNEIFPKNTKVVGVHARGTDSKINYAGHPKSITTDEYIKEAKHILAKSKASYIFLATDDNEILMSFKKEFKESLLYYKDVIRSDGTKMNCFDSSSRENHRFRLGFEILRDVYSLAQCNSFVCSMSYVSMMVQIVNKAYYKDFDFFSRIFKGLRSNGINLEDVNERNKIKEIWENSKND